MSGAFERLLRPMLRAERADRSTAAASYVPVRGVTDALLSSDHHVLVGSRGTGKTHALRYLEAELTRSTLGIPVRSDLRLTWDDPFPLAVPPPLTTERARDIVSSILEDIVVQVSELVTAPDGPVTDAAAVEAAGALSEIVALVGRRTERPSDHVWARVAQSIDVVAATLPGHRLWLLIDDWDSLAVEIAGDVARLLTRIAQDCGALTIKCAAGLAARQRMAPAALYAARSRRGLVVRLVTGYR